ncbi:MAG: hypothetical protein RL378_686 [Actinomycetota bacterium]
MIRKSVFLTAAVICAVVFTGTTPAQAADESAIKRAIVVTVLNNLGVQPTDELVNDIVGDIPMEFFDSTLVREVGTALDDSEDPTLIISQTVDSDGDGVPNADATVDSDDDSNDDADEADDDSSGSSGSSGSDDDTSGSSGSSGSDDDSNDDADDDSDEDEEDGDDDDN